MIAVLSNIHGNLEALNEVISDFSAFKVEEIWILGDLVGDGASNLEVIDKIERLSKYKGLVTRIIKGNYDDAIIHHHINPSPNFEITYREVHANRGQRFINLVTPDPEINLPLDFNQFIRGIHVEDTDKDFITQINSFQYGEELKITFNGYSHLQGFKVKEDQLIINSGSVGCFSNKELKAQYVILDFIHHVCLFRKVSYDIDTTYCKIVESGRSLAFIK